MNKLPKKFYFDGWVTIKKQYAEEREVACTLCNQPCIRINCAKPICLDCKLKRRRANALEDSKRRREAKSLIKANMV